MEGRGEDQKHHWGLGLPEMAEAREEYSILSDWLSVLDVPPLNVPSNHKGKIYYAQLPDWSSIWRYEPCKNVGHKEPVSLTWLITKVEIKAWSSK